MSPIVIKKSSLITQKAAVKKMDMQATREFLAELKVLTRVHHLNLVLFEIWSIFLCFRLTKRIAALKPKYLSTDNHVGAFDWILY